MYVPVLEPRVLEQHEDTFRVRIRVHKRSGPVGAVYDVWSIVRYQRNGRDAIYSASDSERIREVKNAGKPDERRLPPDQGSAYLWRASTFSRFSEHIAGGVLVEFETSA